MNNTSINNQTRPGFTLLEVIVAVIVASIMGTMLVTYMGTSLTRSAEPVIMVQRNAALTQVMENITSDYRELMAQDQNPLTALTSRIQNGNINDPSDSWPDYGYYSLVQCQEQVLESGENSRVLWVTISSGNQRLTALFTQ